MASEHKESLIRELLLPCLYLPFSSKAIVPTNADLLITITDVIVNYQLTQKFVNPTNEDLSVLYIFPVYFKYLFHNLTLFNHRKEIIGQTEIILPDPDKKAKSFSEDIGKWLKFQFYWTDLKEVAMFQIKELKPGLEITLEVNFSSTVSFSIEKNRGFKLKIPYYLFFCMNQKDNDEGGDIIIKMNLSRSLKNIICPSHEAQIKISQDRKSVLFKKQNRRLASINQRNYSDLVLYYEIEQMKRPLLSIQKSTTHKQYCAMIAFTPIFNKDSQIQDYFHSRIYKGGECIVIYDMVNLSVQELYFTRKAILFFLQKIDCSFRINICKIDSDSEFLFPVSTIIDEPEYRACKAFLKKSKAKMLQEKNENFDASQEKKPSHERESCLLECLGVIFQIPIDRNYPRQIVLFSKGYFQNKQYLFDFLKKNIHLTKLHTVGILPNSTTQTQINFDDLHSLSKIGRGKLERIEQQNYEMVLKSLIPKICVDCFTNLQIKWSHVISTSYIFPKKKEKHTVFKDEIFLSFALLKDIIPSIVVLQGNNNEERKIQSFIMNLDKDSIMSGEDLYQIGVNHILSQLQNDYLKKKAIINLSLEYQIPSSKTKIIAKNILISDRLEEKRIRFKLFQGFEKKNYELHLTVKEKNENILLRGNTVGFGEDSTRTEPKPLLKKMKSDQISAEWYEEEKKIEQEELNELKRIGLQKSEDQISHFRKRESELEEDKLPRQLKRKEKKISIFSFLGKKLKNIFSKKEKKKETLRDPKEFKIGSSNKIQIKIDESTLCPITKNISFSN